MRKYIAPFLLQFAAIISVFGQSHIDTAAVNQTKDAGFNTAQYKAYKYTRVSGGATQILPFRLLWPTKYKENPTTKFPLVIMLHGRGEAGSDNNYQLKWGGIEHLNAVNNVYNGYVGPRKFDGFVLYPQEPYGQWTNSPYFANSPQLTTSLSQVHDVIDSLIKKYRVDPDRIVIHGLSSGGTGTWASLYHRPDLFAAALPMSTPGDLSQMGKVVNIPIWLFQGGLDNNPIPYISHQVIQALRDSGAVDTDVTRYTEYPNIGHGVWSTAYAEPDFFPYILRYRKNRIMVLSKNPFCPGLSSTLGFSEGFYNYQWYKEGGIIPGATSNKLRNIIANGNYQVKYQVTPTSSVSASDVVYIYQDVAAPKPAVTSSQSLIVPSPSGSTLVLSGPSGFQLYQWSNGVTTQQNTITNSGSYSLKVKQAAGCISVSSDTFAIKVGSMGSPVPSMATNIKAIPISPDSVLVSWNDVTDETGYEIYRSNQANSGYVFVKLVPANTVSFADFGLNPSTGYYYKIRSVNKVAATLSSERAYVETFKDVVIPSIPQNLLMYNLTSTGQITLLWNKASDKYPLKRYAVYSGNVLLGSTTDTTFSFNLNRNEVYMFSVEAEDFSGNKSGRSNTVPFAYNGSGLYANFYVKKDPNDPWNKLPDFTQLTPDRQVTINYLGSINGTTLTPMVPNSTPTSAISSLSNTNFINVSSYFALKISGFIKVPNTGSWTFYNSSDDGARLTINNTIIINRNAPQGTTETAGSISLTSGIWYPFTYEYFQAGGGLFLALTWKGPAGGSFPSKSTIPAGSLNFFGADPTTFSTAPVTTYFNGMAGNDISNNSAQKVRLSISFTSTPDPTIKSFEIYKAKAPSTSSNVLATTIFSKITSIVRSGNGLAYNFVDSANILPLTRYFYYLKFLSETGSTSVYNFQGAYINGFGGDKKVDIGNVTVNAPTVIPILQSVTGISNSIIRLGFFDNSCPNESGFEIWKSQDPAKYFTKVGLAPSNAIGFDDSTGVINTTYYYKLKAYNQAGASAFSNVISGLTLNIPNAPSNLKVVVVGPKYVNLTWQNNSITSGYGFSIFKSTSKNGVYLKVDSIANPGLTFYQDTSSALTQKYYYKIRAYNINKSTFSNIDSSSIYLPVTPSTLSWKMPVKDVVNNFKNYSGSPFTAYNNNIVKLKTDLIATKDFLRYLYIEKNDNAYFSIKLPLASALTYGGLITFNVMSVKNLTPDTAKIADEFFSFTGSTYNRYQIIISSSNDSITYTPFSVQPWFSKYSNQLQKIDVPASLAGQWIKVDITSQSNNSNYGGLLITEIGAYSLLGPGVRHNYFLLEGASVEKTNIPLGMIQFRKQLAKIPDLSAYAQEALIFNLSTPGVPSKYLKDSINTDLSRHPYATCVIVHQGGNDVNSSTNGVRPLIYSKLSSLPAAKNLIDNFTSIIQSIQSSGKLALISRMHFRDYKDYCPGTTRIAAFVSPSPPAALRGRSQENGSLPINLLIDSLTKSLTPYAYNFAEKRSNVNYYPIFLNRQKMLGPDGIHPSSVPFGSSYSNPYVDIMANYWINYAMRYVFTGKFANPEDYDANNQLIPVGPADTICAILPANKPNLLPLTKAAVEKAEQTKTGNDIWEARILVEQMRNVDGRINYVNRLDSLRDYRSPANPTSLLATVIDGSTVSLTWLDNDVIQTAYQVYKSNNNGSSYKLATQLPASSSQYNVSGLSGDTLYTFYVRAINDKFKSGWTNLVTARPSVTYYSAANGIITNTTTWGRQNDGTGSNPTNFITGSQVYVFANRPDETVLNSNWDVTGNYSKIVLSQGTKLKIAKGVILNAILELGAGSQLKVKADSVPVLSLIDSLSTLVISGTSRLKNKNYGTLKFDSIGIKTLVNDTVNVKGNLILESAVTLKGKPTVIRLSGDLILNDSFPVFENITLVLLKKSHQIDTKAGHLSLNSLIYSDTSTITLLNGSQLRLGSVSGGGLIPGQNSTINIGSGVLSIEGNGALNPSNKIARISSYLGILNINTTSSLDSYIYPSISGFNFKDITSNISVGRTVFLKDSLKLSNTLKLKSGTFNTGNYLILASDIYGTARIAKVEANAILSGDIKWQRLIGPFKKQSYYYVGTPIKLTKAAILDKYFTILGFQPNQISTLASYSEPIGKWNGVKDSNTVLGMGIGYRALLKNNDIIYPDSSGYLEISGPPMVGDGTSNTGTLNIPVTKSNIGWNVVSNPYPCEIDWKAITVISPDVEDAFYMWDGAKKTYRVYKGPGGTGTPGIATLGMSPIINSGQGFVVKAKNNGYLNINENAKRSDTIQPVFYREASYPFLRINLRNEEYQADEAILRFYDDATKSFDVEYDAMKYVGNYQNISTIAGVDNLTINTLPYYAKNLSVTVYVQAYYKGNFYLDFSEMESFPSDIDIYLKDNLLSTLTDVRKNFSYQFSSTALDTKTRFEIVFNNLPSAMVTNYENSSSVTNNLIVHPNPAEHATSFNIMLESAGLINLEVMNVNGQIVYNSQIAGQYGPNTIDWNIEKDKIMAGIYYYKVNTNGKDYTGKLVIQ